MFSGVTHGADACFFFYSPAFGLELSDTVSDDYRMRKRLVKLWTTFAKTGYVHTHTQVYVNKVIPKAF